MNYLSRLRKKNKNANLFIAFLFFACLSVLPEHVCAQQKHAVSLDVKNETVENVVKLLGQQTGVKFFYDQHVISTSPRVTIKASGASLQSVLQQISSQTRLSFEQENNTITIGTRSNAQSVEHHATRNVSGVVVDANDLPIIGANVLQKGTSTGRLTDKDGKLSINASDGDKLVSSLSGYVYKV